MRWLIIVLAVIAIIVVAVILAVAVGRRSWRERVDHRFAEVVGVASTVTSLPLLDTASVDAMPPPVQRFLGKVLRDGSGVGRVVRLRQRGQMVLGKDPDGWVDFTAEQIVAPQGRAYAWSATVDMMPLLKVRVLDSYINGQASMHGSIEGLIDVVHAASTPQLASAALMRFAGECVWMPWALLPSEHVGWTAIDDRRAMLRMHDRGVTIDLECTFNAEGDLVRVYTPARWAEQDGRSVQLPWDVRILRYDDVGGRRIAVSCEVAWYHAGERRPWWRGTITDITSE
jgi:hypothetical protein